MKVKVSSKVSIQGQKIADKVAPIFKLECENLATELKISIKSSVYPWNKETKRKSGEVVKSPRNIFDLGDFYNSQKLVFINPTKAEIIWDVDYAEVILFGNKTRPGANWITFTFNRKPLKYFDPRKPFVMGSK